jgi:hypothetical protein
MRIAASPMLRFTIRDVLWLTALVAVVVTWGIDRYTFALKLEALQSDYELAKAEIQQAQAEAIMESSRAAAVSAQMQHLQAVRDCP